MAEKEKELRRLVREGVLEGKGRGRSLRIPRAAFYAWLDEPVPVEPDRGCGYEVLPDAEKERVECLRRQREELWDRLRDSPANAFELRLKTDEVSTWVAMTEGLEARIKANFQSHWHELRAVEVVLEEAAAEFDGTDVLKPILREDLEETKAGILETTEFLKAWQEDYELGDAGTEEIDQVREAVRYWSEP